MQDADAFGSVKSAGTKKVNSILGEEVFLVLIPLSQKRDLSASSGIFSVDGFRTDVFALRGSPLCAPG